MLFGPERKALGSRCVRRVELGLVQGVLLRGIGSAGHFLRELAALLSLAFVHAILFNLLGLNLIIISKFNIIWNCIKGLSFIRDARSDILLFAGLRRDRLAPLILQSRLRMGIGLALGAIRGLLVPGFVGVVRNQEPLVARHSPSAVLVLSQYLLHLVRCDVCGSVVLLKPIELAISDYHDDVYGALV